MKTAPVGDLLRLKEKTVMTKKEIELLDTVSLVEDLPARELHRGAVGALVEILDGDVYEVEFCDDARTDLH